MRQNYVCCDYHWRELPQVSFMSWQKFRHSVCRNKTGLFSRQNYACHDKSFVATKVCLLRQTKLLSWQIFVTANLIMSGQNMSFVATKTFVATKIMLVAVPANDTEQILTVWTTLSVYHDFPSAAWKSKGRLMFTMTCKCAWKKSTDACNDTVHGEKKDGYRCLQCPVNNVHETTVHTFRYEYIQHVFSFS